MKHDPAPLPCTLDRISPFDLLDPLQRQSLLNSAQVVRASRGEIISQAGDRVDVVHMVLEGEVKCFLLAASGNETLIRLARNGEVFGEESGLIGRPALTGAQAVRDSRLLLIPVAGLHDAMTASPQFAAAIGTRLAAAAYELMAHLQLCLQLNSTQRVAQYLSQLAPEDAECCEIHLENDKQTIAAQLNLTPETLSRVLSRFTREGMIRSSGRRRLMLDKLSQLRHCATQ